MWKDFHHLVFHVPFPKMAFKAFTSLYQLTEMSGEGEVPQGLGICRLGTYARALGYGDFLGVELPDEADGIIPDPKWNVCKPLS